MFRGQGMRQKPAKENKKGSPVSQKGNKESVIFGNQEKKVFYGRGVMSYVKCC